jgi:uncharacterized phage infection (PIP) family protein YhgE
MNDQYSGSPADQDEAQADGSVDKIRDIIFGRTMRDYERRFKELEQRITSDNRRLSEDLSARFEQLDAYMRNEFELHAQRAATERRERKEALDEQSASLADASRNLAEKIADVDESLASAAQDIRGRLHDQTSELLDLIRRAKSDLTSSIRDESTRLREDKVARDDLANMLQELAMKIAREGDTTDGQSD